MQLECMGGPLDGKVLTISDDTTGFIADPVSAGAPRTRYVVRRVTVRIAETGTVVDVCQLVFDGWLSD